MSYTPTEWKNGDTITAEKLNHIESGIDDNNVLIVEYGDIIDGTTYLNKTVGEIWDAFVAKKMVLFYSEDIVLESDAQKQFFVGVAPIYSIHFHEETYEYIRWDGYLECNAVNAVIGSVYPNPPITTLEELRNSYPYIYQE